MTTLLSPLWSTPNETTQKVKTSLNKQILQDITMKLTFHKEYCPTGKPFPNLCASSEETKFKPFCVMFLQCSNQIISNKVKNNTARPCISGPSDLWKPIKPDVLIQVVDIMLSHQICKAHHDLTINPLLTPRGDKSLQCWLLAACFTSMIKGSLFCIKGIFCRFTWLGARWFCSEVQLSEERSVFSGQWNGLGNNTLCCCTLVG